MQVSYNQNHITLKAFKSDDERKRCNIIFVIDISGSMDSIASPTNDNGECDDLTRLNLACHSIKTIISSLHDDDSVGIITFNSNAFIKMDLTNMNSNGKNLAYMVIENLEANGTTNIYDGLKKAFEMLETIKNNNNTSIVLLTDGVSNNDPPNGILQTLINNYDINKMKPFTLNTFGFSYDINSELLRSLANYYNGIFGFIPECSMVGTVFINYLTNLLATHVINLKVDITYDDNTREIINTGSILYNSQRDLIMDKNIKSVDLFYNNSKIDYQKIEYINDEINYNNNKTRIEIVKIINTIIDNYQNKFECCNKIKKISNLINSFSSNDLIDILDKYYIHIYNNNNNEHIKNYVKDYMNNDVIYDNYNINNNAGQIKLALSNNNYYDKWGKHYLISLMYGYENQLCINFKDNGIQNFLTPNIEKIRNEIETNFCNIPPPVPKVIRAKTTRLSSMEAYYRTDSVCFDGNGIVYMSNNTTKLVKELKKGDEILTMNNKTAKIICIIKQNINSKIDVCYVNGIYITPYHPIFIYNKWNFPITHFKSENKYIDSIYNLVLDSNHSILINFIPVITLGHNFNYNNITKHEYFGSNKVINDLEKMNGYEEGLIECNKLEVIRNRNTNEVIKLNYI
jgi:uncharacterized protein YegL